jgi:hypothetical protein
MVPLFSLRVGPRRSTIVPQKQEVVRLLRYLKGLHESMGRLMTKTKEVFPGAV